MPRPDAFGRGSLLIWQAKKTGWQFAQYFERYVCQADCRLLSLCSTSFEIIALQLATPCGRSKIDTLLWGLQVCIQLYSCNAWTQIFGLVPPSLVHDPKGDFMGVHVVADVNA